MELFRLLGTIAINNSDAMKAMDDTVEKGSDTQSKLSTAFTKIGNAAKTCGKVVGAGMLAASSAIIGLGASALASYADFEQLVGGVETLFKDSAGIVREYADEAYKSAGMSANAYMEQVTSFSASLIQSLNGDTQAAAEKANQAIIDMSDNANKMGTSIDMIQNAYQGFAKQNYTMLDNLKLGYGGTKEEMQRLLNDAQAISGVEYDISSYADVVDAIHVIQEEMGIAGTTAKEASSTISGSFNSMKAAWSNLLAGLGNENADLSALTDNFIDSALTVVDNVVPRIEVILGGMVTVIEKLLPKLMEHLPSILQSFLPSLVRGATALVTGLIKALPSILMLLTEQLPFILSEIGKALVETAPVLLEAAQQLFGQVWEYIMSTFNSNGELDGVLSGISAAFSTLWEVCNTAWTTIGQPIWDMVSTAFSSLYNLVAENMPEIQAFVSEAFAGIQDTWENHLKPAFEAIGAFLNDYVVPAFEYAWQNFILPLIENVFSLIGQLWTGTLKPIFDAICDFITGVFTGDWQLMGESILNIVTALWNGIVAIIDTLLRYLAEVWVNIEGDVKESWESIKSAIVGKFTEVKNSVASIITDIRDGLNSKIETIKTNIATKFTEAKDNVLSIFTNIHEGISEKMETAKSVVSGAIEKIKGFFDFEWSLPSLKLPHVSIEGEFSLNPPSTPTFGIEWYKDGGVLNAATIFGMNGNNLMVGGEAGAEAVAPIDVLQGYVAEAVASQNSGLIIVLQQILEAILAMDANMGGNLREALDGTAFSVNNREFARLVKAVM